MQPTYFASFLLGEKPDVPPPPVADALEIVADWLFENPHRALLRPKAWPDLVEPAMFPNGEKIQLLRLEDGVEGVQTCAVRFEHPDQQSRVWRTDCVLTRVTDPEPAVRFAVSIAAGGASDGLYALRPPSSRPRIVRSIMDKFGGRESYPLKSTFFNIAASEAEPFAGFLLDPVRKIPVVFVSRRNQDAGLLCDPSELADKLVGIAYVCVAESSQLSWNLANFIDNRLNTYDGSIRVYWPRMTADDPPYRYRWWTERQLEASGRPFADDILRMVATASITRHVPGLVRWEDIERENTRRTIQRLQKSGDVSAKVSEEWLSQYESDLASLDGARRELETLSGRLLERDAELHQWKQMYLQALRSNAGESPEALSAEPEIEDAKSAIEAARKDFSGSLEIIDSRISKESFQFEEPELLYPAFKWLATTYRNTKAGIQRCDDLAKSCREICQFRYSAHQSEVTMGMFSADYEINYRGAKEKLREHIGFGTSTEPRHAIRIAFFLDEETQKVIIGFIGQHQATRRSN